MPKPTASARFLKRWRQLSVELAGRVGGVCHRPGSVDAMLARLEAVAGGGNVTWTELRRIMANTLHVLLDELEGEV